MMAKDPKDQIEEQEHQELDEEQTEEVAGGKNMTAEQLKKIAAAGEGNLPMPKLRDEDLKKVAGGRDASKDRDRAIH